MKSRTRSRTQSGVLLLLGIICGLLPAAALASNERCFNETRYCIAGQIRTYWERTGGIPVFGFPITPLQLEMVEGSQRRVQWFERARLEIHEENAAPYNVLLGRLGADALRRRSASAPAQVEGACRVFPETGLTACGAILDAWHASGLELDGAPGFSEAENLALFGLPLSPPRVELLSDGRRYTVQWFERARFEIHPEGVLLGLLGSERSPIAGIPLIETGGVPARIGISAIGLDARITAVGVDDRGEPIVPNHDVGWFDQSGLPGAGENIVLWGHVLRFTEAPNIPAPFAAMDQLGIGATVSLVDQYGTEYRYRVIRRVIATPDQVQYILPQGRELLTLVSCYGEQVIVGNEVVDMSNRLITIAEPAR